jgi:hypothetical protein
MRAAARALLENLIDYAGMFPPARLPLAEALHRYRELRGTPEAWMLGRFVCAAGDLRALRNELDGDPTAVRLDVAALCKGGSSPAEFARNLDADLQAMRGLRAGPGAPVTADVIELPLAFSFRSDAIAALVDLVMPRIHAQSLRLFIEVPVGPAWQEQVETFAGVLGTRTTAASDVPLPLGLKIRCGGTAIPTADQLAMFIQHCRAARVPWKATAGLHHPIRRSETAAAPHAMSHGFLNVFAAGILAEVHDLKSAQLRELLQEGSVDAFHFTDTHFGWRTWQCSAEQIRSARRWVVSFGSCSFDEPRDELHGLGLLG